MEWAGSVEARAPTRFLWWTLHRTRAAAVAALLPCRSKETGHGVSVSACPGTARSAGCRASYRWKQPPDIGLPRLGVSVSAFHPARRSAAGRGRASARALRCCRSRGRRRKAEYVGDDGVGGAQHRGEQCRQVEIALAGGAYNAGEDLLGVGALAGAVAAAHLTGD